MSMNEALKKLLGEIRFLPDNNNCFCKDVKLDDLEKRGFLSAYDKESKTYKIVFFSKHKICDKFRLSIVTSRKNEVDENA